MTNWEKEKARNARRAQELSAAMETAIANRDREQFEQAYTTAFRYMTKRQRSPYYIRFLTAMRACR